MMSFLDRLREGALEIRLRRYEKRRFLPRKKRAQFQAKIQLFYESLIAEARRLAQDELAPDCVVDIARADCVVDIARADCVVDIGCADWGYLPALVSSFPSAQRIFGFEADPGRLYWDGRMRGQLAEDRAEAVSCAPASSCMAIFVPGDFLLAPLPWTPHPKTSRVNLLFASFFPFVSPDPAHAWGLPSRHSDFEAIVHRVEEHAGRLGLGASLLTVHQGAWEDEIAERILRSAGWTTRMTRIESARFRALWPGTHDVFVRFSEKRQK